jgi:hypothetical protein
MRPSGIVISSYPVLKKEIGPFYETYEEQMMQ